MNIEEITPTDCDVAVPFNVTAMHIDFACRDKHRWKVVRVVSCDNHFSCKRGEIIYVASAEKWIEEAKSVSYALEKNGDSISLIYRDLKQAWIDCSTIIALFGNGERDRDQKPGHDPIEAMSHSWPVTSISPVASDFNTAFAVLHEREVVQLKKELNDSRQSYREVCIERDDCLIRLKQAEDELAKVKRELSEAKVLHERDAYAGAIMTALAGIICTPQDGYLADGGPRLAASDLIKMRNLAQEGLKIVGMMRKAAVNFIRDTEPIAKEHNL